MIIVSKVIDWAARWGTPRFRHRVHLARLERWRNAEREYFLLNRLVDPTRAAVDVGANEGLYAGRLAQLTRTVHCFEPIPWLADALTRKLPRRVEIHRCALSNRATTGELRIPYRGDDEMHGTSTLEASNPLADATTIRVISCPVKRLDDMTDLGPVGFIKIDVEGHEMAVLEGATSILRQHRPALLIESEKRHNAAAPESIFEFLHDLDYEGFFLQAGRLQPVSVLSAALNERAYGGPDYVNNFIFLPAGSNKLAALMADHR